MPKCCGCGLTYPKNVFAKAQLKKPAHRRRCLGCAAEVSDAEQHGSAGGGGDDVQQRARTSEASESINTSSATPSACDTGTSASAQPPSEAALVAECLAAVRSDDPGRNVMEFLERYCGPNAAVPPPPRSAEADALVEGMFERYRAAENSSSRSSGSPNCASRATTADVSESAATGTCALSSDEVTALLDSLLEAKRITQDEYLAARVANCNADSNQKNRLLAEWKPFALSLPCHVTVHGLVSRSDLNGKAGTAVSWLPDSKRYSVEFGSGRDKRNKKLVAIRPANLRESIDIDISEPTKGRCWDGHLWGASILRCDGRIPVHGEVCCIMEGPYLNMTEEEKAELECGAGVKDRKAAAVVFTYEGYAHILKSPDLGGTSMLVESAKIQLRPQLEVHKAYSVDDGKHLLVFATEPDNWDRTRLALFDYPQMSLIELWDETDGAEFTEEIRKVDFFEDFLVVLFHSDDRPSKDTRLCCYQYRGSSLEMVASWTFTGELSELQTRLGRICDLCVTSGGGIGARLATLSYDGLVRIWCADSIAGCTAILNGSLENLGGAGKVGGLSQADSGGGIITRVPRVMQNQLAKFHSLSSDILDIVTCHRGTVSFWQTGLTRHRSPARILAITNPMADNRTVKGFIMDKGLSTGICIQTGDLCVEYEDEEEMDVTQLVLWSPFKKSANIAFEMPAEFEIPSNRGVCFSGGRLLIASGPEDAAKSSLRGEKLVYGKKTCYLYVVSAREDEDYLPSQNAKPRIGIDSTGVRGMLEGLLAGTSAIDIPRGINITIAMPHICAGDDGISTAETQEVRPCCHLCHGCGKFVCARILLVCTGCHGAYFCSKRCQKKAWSMHKPTCKGAQALMSWFKEQGYCTL